MHLDKPYQLYQKLMTNYLIFLKISKSVKNQGIIHFMMHNCLDYQMKVDLESGNMFEIK